jgi:uncharacterized membrane protein
MDEWLTIATKDVALVIDAMVLLIVSVAALQAFVLCLREMLVPAATGHERRHIWLQLGRWLVAALTFQLASDIIRTSIAPSFEELGRLAIVAAIRVFLNYFLERDISEIRIREGDSEQVKPAPE